LSIFYAPLHGHHQPRGAQAHAASAARSAVSAYVVAANFLDMPAVVV
jgi:hypothetical protein